MAILHQGILGGFTGKLGNIVGFRYRSKWCIRRSPSPSSKPPTAKQMAHREKFALAMLIASPLRAQLDQLPEHGKKRLSAYNRFISNLMRTALAPSSIDYNLMKITQGPLPKGFCHYMGFSNNEAKIFWCETGMLKRGKQEAMVNIYSPLLQTWASYCLPVDGSCELSVPVPCDFMHSNAHVFMYFRADGGKLVSNSIYLGSTLPEPAFNSTINLN